ncbi:AMP-binding protein, partial [Streptomyces sp. NPDC051677]|uniref:non-ribosomal peptide synthetase n=1 Tax=Streptomyces sp. NPDC051677 TaxID=3365669 RepID=UPI0037D20EF8
TGRPKGVASVHHGWVNRMAWMQRRFALRAGETVLHKTTLTFDDSCLEIFWPLAYGGRVALIEPGRHRDPRAVLDAAIASQAVHLQTVPSMLSLLLDTITPEDRKALALRAVVSSGEALLPGAVRRFEKLFPGRLHNTWGATEVSIDSTIHTCSAADHDDTGAVSIGIPFDNNRVTVRDTALHEVPPGVIGDLYISGTGLARGYLNDPVKTAGAFVPDPDDPGARMYRTGDQGFRRPDGSLKFTGRNDHQVKIRGMRVELGEIEATLSRHPQVVEAVVTVQAASAELKRLVAHVVPTGDGTLSPGAVRAYLTGKLPEHMVPSFVLLHEALPLNANGKVDRKRLPEPDRLRDYTEVEYVAPGRDTEIALAGMWQELLGIDRVGIRDSFFALGGHSLAVTRLNARIQRRFGVGLPLQTIFDRPTIEAMAGELERRLLEHVNELSEDEVAALLEEMAK